MSKIKIAVIAAAVVVVVLLLVFIPPTTLLHLGCDLGPLITGSGPVVTKEYLIEGFNWVVVSSAVEVEITRSIDHSITITGYENLIERLEVDLSGQKLIIRLKPGRYFNNNVKAVITMPDLSKFVVSGASSGTAKGFTSADDFDLEVSGASRVDFSIETGNTNLNISGASKVAGELKAQDIRLTVSGVSHCELTGSGGNTNLNVSGASQVNLLQFQIQNADVNISGASRATINMTGTLNVDLSAASSLEYTGDVDLGKVTITGASRMSSQ